MKKPFKIRKRFVLLLSVTALASLVVFLAYEYWLYQPRVVNNGYVAPVLTFKKHHDIVTSVRFANDTTIVSSGVDSSVKIWNARTGKLVRSWRQPSGIPYMDLSADGKYVATAGYDSKVRVWKTADASLVYELSGDEGTVWDVAFNPAGTQLASGGDDAVVRIWDLSTGKLTRALKGHTRIIWAVKFSRDGTRVASASFDDSWKLWDVNTGKIMWDNREHTQTVVDLAFSYDNQRIATASDDGSARIWDLRHKNLVQKFDVPEHVQAVAFSPDNKRLLAGGRDKTLVGELLQNFFGTASSNPGVSARLWDIETGKLLHCFTNHMDDVMDVAFSPGGRYLATASADHTVEVWRVMK